MEISSADPKMKTTDDNEVVKSKKGGLRALPFVIANETLEKVASFGLLPNMIMYLKSEFHMSTATGTNVLFLWSAVSYFLPIIGAFLSDTYFGRYSVIAVGIVISFLGLILLWLTAIIPEATPGGYCDLRIGNCTPANSGQLALLFSSFVLISIGAGGVRPCSLAFGADQLQNPDNPNNERIMQIFFNWYYVSVVISLMFSVVVIVYIQDTAGWIVGFGVPVGLMFLSIVLFFMGSSLYVKMKANTNLFRSLAKVISAAWNNRHLALPPRDSDGWYHHDGSKLKIPTQKLRFLNKACLIKNPEKYLDPDTSDNVCTVRQVEELKALIKVLPIWSTGIMLAVTINQHSFPFLQALSMDRKIITEKFKIPPGSFVVFSILSLTICVGIYDRILVPLLAKFTKRKKGLSVKQRMGVGLAISCLAMAVSAIVERRRRNTAIAEGFLNNPIAVVSMSAYWLLPQYCLIGFADAFNIIGQIEFYYSQFPKSLASIAVALLSLGLAVGNVVGSIIVTITNTATKKGGKIGWIASNINQGRYDYYYWILCFLSVINFFYYLVCSWAYGSCQDIEDWDEDGATKGKDGERSEIKGSPTIIYPESPLVSYISPKHM